MITKAPSSGDGKRVGTPMQSTSANGAGITDRPTRAWNTVIAGKRHFGRLRTDAINCDESAVAALRQRAVKWKANGWKEKTIAKHLGTTVAVVEALLK
jgi:hypothetical protein